MKKIVSLILVVACLLSCFVLVSCNMDLLDTTYHFDRAIIYLPDGEIVEGAVESWSDYENSDQIQVKINGTTYLVHSTNIVLISE